MQFGIGDNATAANDRTGERGQGFKFGVGQRGLRAQTFDQILRQIALFVGDSGVAGHAKGAAMVGRGGDLHHLALGQRKTGATVDLGNRQIGFQSGRRIGEHAQQVGNIAIPGLGAGQVRLAGLRRRFKRLYGKAGHRDSSDTQSFSECPSMLRKANCIPNQEFLLCL